MQTLHKCNNFLFLYILIKKYIKVFGYIIIGECKNIPYITNYFLGYFSLILNSINVSKILNYQKSFKLHLDIIT